MSNKDLTIIALGAFIGYMGMQIIRLLMPFQIPTPVAAIILIICSFYGADKAYHWYYKK